MDITRRYHQGNLFSVMAHNSLTDKSAMLKKVTDYVRSQGTLGATGDEVEMALGMSHQTVSARLTEAKKKNLVEWYGDSRLTRSGRKAAVLIWKI